MCVCVWACLKKQANGCNSRCVSTLNMRHCTKCVRVRACACEYRAFVCLLCEFPVFVFFVVVFPKPAVAAYLGPVVALGVVVVLGGQLAVRVFVGGHAVVVVLVVVVLDALVQRVCGGGSRGKKKVTKNPRWRRTSVRPLRYLNGSRGDLVSQHTKQRDRRVPLT